MPKTWQALGSLQTFQQSYRSIGSFLTMSTRSNKPLGLLAELTYRCPYCSNPFNLADYRDELTLEEWVRVLVEARTLGVLQLHLSGGEPLQRRDLLALVTQARELGFYTDLITSALSLTSAKTEQLKAAERDHVQISFQAATPLLSDHIAGTPSYERKIAAARVVIGLGFPLTLNVVVHRHNIDHIATILALAEELAADRVELTNTQYYGWALHNRAALLLTWDQLQRAEPVVHAARTRLAGKMQILYVVPDYYSRYPKPCMGDWVIGGVISSWSRPMVTYFLALRLHKSPCYLVRTYGSSIST